MTVLGTLPYEESMDDEKDLQGDKKKKPAGLKKKSA